MPPVRVLDVQGTHFDMGYQHGLAYASDIRHLAAERMHLSCEPTWTGRALSRETVLELAEACLEAHCDYAPELVEQLEGISKATGVSLPELIIANGFTDFVDLVYNAPGQPAVSAKHGKAEHGNECTALLIGPQATDQGGILAQTWDMHATARPHVILLRARPANEPAFIAFTLTGCVAMIGMNEAGIAIGINNLVGADGQVGVTWPFVCRKALAQDNLEDALACITSARLAGGHNYMLIDASGRGYNIEAMATTCVITPLENDDVLAHANACRHDITQAVERPLSRELEVDSACRHDRALALLNQRPIQPEHLMELMRNREDGPYSICAMSEPPFYSETCGAIIMRPAERDLWAVWGLPIDHPFEHFAL